MSIKVFFRNIGHIISFPFVALSLTIGLLKSKKIFKHYERDPESYLENERYEHVYKQTKKAIFIANCKINFEGLDKIPQTPVMYVCNHKSSFDPLILLKIFSEDERIVRPVFVSKIELLENQKIGDSAKLIDTIFLDRNNIRSAMKALEKERETLIKKSVVVFIEGTRIKTEEFGEFKSAALEPAYSKMRTIIPVVIHGSKGVEKENIKGFFKYKEINVKFLEPLKYKDFFDKSRDSIAETLKQKMYNQYLKFNDKKD